LNAVCIGYLIWVIKPGEIMVNNGRIKFGCYCVGRFLFGFGTLIVTNELVDIVMDVFENTLNGLYFFLFIGFILFLIYQLLPLLL
jgi:hypothetical protein